MSPTPDSAPVSALPGKSRTKVRLIGGAVLVVLLAVGAGIYGRNRVKPVPVTVEKAAVRNLTQLVTATGKIQPEIEVKISPEVFGEIVELPLQEGDQVKKGQLLVRIKPDNYQAQTEQAEAALVQARSAAVLSQAKLDKAALDLKQYQDLYERKLVSDFDHAVYRTNYDVARADYESAKANVSRAEGSLNQARDTLSKTALYAPMDGTISSRSCELGERVVATGQFNGTEIMRVADLGSMEARVQVNENDIVNVKLGDHALVSIDAYAGRKFNGVVKEIASTGTTTGANTQAEVTDFQVKIRITDRDAPLRPGMSATADIETATVHGVITVPIQSVTVRDLASGKSAEELQQDQARASGDSQTSATNVRDQAHASREHLPYVLFVKQGNQVHLRKVEIGISDNTYTEIKSGVQPGEEVVSGTYTAISRTLKEAMKVGLDKPAAARPQ